MVSIVMPETGLRAVVAMALAATEVKKKEKTSVSTGRVRPRSRIPGRVPKKHRHADRANHDSEKNGHHRDVAIGALRRSGFASAGKRAARCRRNRPRSATTSQCRRCPRSRSRRRR